LSEKIGQQFRQWLQSLAGKYQENLMAKRRSEDGRYVQWIHHLWIAQGCPDEVVVGRGAVQLHMPNCEGVAPTDEQRREAQQMADNLKAQMERMGRKLYSDDEVMNIYLAGKQAGIAAYDNALKENGEYDGVKERANAAIDATAEEDLEHALKRLKAARR
jgi:hypothetical protein